MSDKRELGQRMLAVGLALRTFDGENVIDQIESMDRDELVEMTKGLLAINVSMIPFIAAVDGDSPQETLSFLLENLEKAYWDN